MFTTSVFISVNGDGYISLTRDFFFLFQNLYLIYYSTSSVYALCFSAMRHVGSYLPGQGLSLYTFH